MDFDFSWLGRLFATENASFGDIGVGQAFVLAAVVLVALVLLASLATVVSRWLSHSVDRIFELLLLMAIGAALLWVYMGAPFYR